MHETDRDVRIAKARTAMDHLASVVDRLRKAGFACEVVSAGGTGTYNIAGADPRVTEIQAGSYVFMDKFHGNLVPGFEVALTVLSTVVIRHGDTIVFDAGRNRSASTSCCRRWWNTPSTRPSTTPKSTPCSM